MKTITIMLIAVAASAADGPPVTKTDTNPAADPAFVAARANLMEKSLIFWNLKATEMQFESLTYQDLYWGRDPKNNKEKTTEFAKKAAEVFPVMQQAMQAAGAACKGKWNEQTYTCTPNPPAAPVAEPPKGPTSK